MKKTMFFRCGKVVRTLNGDVHFPSLNKAKKESRALQQQHGGLGSGVLRVVDRLPPFKKPQD